jgi:hypothetical protein
MMAYPLLSSTAVAPTARMANHAVTMTMRLLSHFVNASPRNSCRYFPVRKEIFLQAGADIAISNESNTNKGIVSAAHLFNREPANDCP